MNRRHSVKTAALAGASTLALHGKAWPFAQSPNNIRKFVVSPQTLGRLRKMRLDNTSLWPRSTRPLSPDKLPTFTRPQPRFSARKCIQT